MDKGVREEVLLRPWLVPMREARGIVGVGKLYFMGGSGVRKLHRGVAAVVGMLETYIGTSDDPPHNVKMVVALTGRVRSSIAAEKADNPARYQQTRPDQHTFNHHRNQTSLIDDKIRLNLNLSIT